MSESTRNKIRYNITPLDEEKIRSDSYKLRSYTSASENNPRDQFYRYEANRNDTNLFVSGTYNQTRTQIHDAVYTDFKKGDINVVEFNESKNSLSMVEGYNTDEQKVYGYVFEKIKTNPIQTITFTEQQSMDLVSKTGMFIRNIKIYGSNIGIKNSYMPVTVIAPSDFKGYRAQLSASGVTTAYDITKVHHEGDIKTSLQGPFSNQHVGGYAHRHQPINTGSDNSLNRLEMVSISASGDTINFTSPQLPVRFSRDGGAKRFVNTRRIKTTDPRIAGNYSKNYEVFQATDRNENNLWLRSHPTASFTEIDSPYISGTKDYQVQDFKLGDGTNSKTVIVQKFGAPGGPESNAAVYQDSSSRQFSPYNTVNYRNPLIRYYLNKQFLVNHAEFGNYTTAGYGLTASFHGIQRNTSYYTGSSGIYKKYDNTYVRREIPASPRGYSWIGTRFGTGSFDNNLFVKDYNDPGIAFLSKSIDRNIYFERANLSNEQLELIASSSYFPNTSPSAIQRIDTFQYGINFTPTNNLSLNTFLLSRNKLLGYSTKNQINNYYNPVRIAARKGVIANDSIFGGGFTPVIEQTIGNYVGDTDEKGNFIFFPHSPINNKYENTIIEFELEDGNKEEISLPFASKYAYLGDYYNTSSLKIDHLYKDKRNIRYVNKNDSVFFRILDNDNQRRENNIEFPKINKIKYKEKVWPKVANTFLRRNRDRSYISQVIQWNNEEVLRDELLGSPGDASSVYGTKTNRQVLIGNFLSSLVDPNTTWRVSIWPLDTYTTSSGEQFLDKSGRMMTLDNAFFISSSYAGVGFPSHLPPSGAYVNYLSFGRNYNTNRPKNVVFEQAGSYPYYENYESIDYDAKYNFKNYGVMFSYNPDINLNSYLLFGTTNLPFSYETDSTYNQFSNHASLLNRNESQIVSMETAFVTSKGLENNVYSDYIDLLSDFNKNENLKISKIKFDINAVKKFFQFSSSGLMGYGKIMSNGLPLYPAERLTYSLALNFKTYYLGGNQPGFSITGSIGGTTWKKPALSTFFMPGIACNSIKAGIGLPFSAVTSLPTINIASNSNSITASLNATNYTKVPFEAILDPSKIAGVRVYDADPDLKVYNYLTASSVLDPGFKNDQAYKDLANNFFAETINFYIKDGRLPRIKSKPQNEWYFGDLNKPYSMKLLIFKSNNFDTYTSKESYGPRPYIYHNPPWMTFSGDATLTGSNSVTASTFNSDTMMAPSASYKNASYAIATITFDPRLVTASSQINVGKGAQFSFNEIKRYSTVTYQSSFIDSTAIASGAVNLGDCVEIFGFSEKDETWTPYVKWVCPTANLNFYNTSYGKLTQSNSNDSGQNSPGSAIRGIWHQLGMDVDDNTGLFFQVADNSNATTGSLLDIVGFNSKEKVRIGEVADSKTIEEGVVILPVYLENNSEERLLELNIDKFEKNYSNSDYIKSVDEFSKKFVIPPLLDFMKIRRKSNSPLTKTQYGKVTPPILMFFAEFKSKLLRSDLLRIWQGLMPETARIMEIDDKNIEFDLKNSEIFSYDDLVKFNNTLPTNLRFKIFKVYKRAITNYQNIIDRTLDREIKEDYRLTTSWPYSSFEFVNRAEVKIDLEYDKTFGVSKDSHLDKNGNVVKDTEINQ